MSRRKNNYSKEFKMNAVLLVKEQGLKPKTVSEQFGINYTMLYTWIAKYETHGDKAFVGSGNQVGESAEIRKLKKQLAAAKVENEILKKAAAYFAQHPELK